MTKIALEIIILTLIFANVALCIVSHDWTTCGAWFVAFLSHIEILTLSLDQNE